MSALVDGLQAVADRLKDVGIDAYLERQYLRTPCAWIVPETIGRASSAGRREAVVAVFLLGEGSGDLRQYESLDELLSKFQQAGFARTDEDVRLAGVELTAGGTVTAFRVPIQITL